MFDAFREKYFSLKYFIELFYEIWMKKNVRRSLYGCLHCSKGTKAWLNVALLKILEVDLNLYLILDVPLYVYQKLHVWPLITPAV